MIHFLKNLFKEISTSQKYFFAFFVAVILGLNIYHRCDAPPYGYPLNELSDCYWGPIIDIAHHWRSFDLGLWSRSLAGGISMFTTGAYPILNPTNVFALFLTDDAFYLFKLIEPYFLGFFFMTVLLWDEFKTKWYISLYGGMAYMGLLLSKAFPIAASPYLYYACGLFPLMVLVALKLFRRHIYLAAAGVGALLALQFLGEGSFQTPQMLIWWSIFFIIFSLSNWLKQRQGRALKNGLIALVILAVTSVGLCAVQMFPSLYYFKFESARLQGYYPINNFNLINSDQGPSLLNTFWIAVINAGPIRSKAFVVLGLICLALAVKYFGRIFENNPHRSFIYRLWITLVIYFCFPSFALMLTKIFPFLNSLFSPLTYFTFKYALYTLDFAIILSVCLMLSNDRLSFVKAGNSKIRDYLAWVILFFALVAGVLPLFFATTGNALDGLRTLPVFHYFVPETTKNARSVFIKTLIFILFFILRPRQKIFHLVLAVCLLGSSFMMMLDCFKWYDKGQRTNPELYQIGSPEQVYYSKAKGKFLLPRQGPPGWTMHNFNLLYGVEGTSGFLGAPPLRLMMFKIYYELQMQKDWRNIPFPAQVSKFGAFKDKTPAVLTTYFPADFTLVPKEEGLDWPGFTKTISGDIFDVYEREKPVAPVYIAHHLKVVDFFDLIEKFDAPRSDTVYVTQKDATLLNIQNEDFNNTVEPQINNFKKPSPGRISFQSVSDQPFFAIIPDSYQSGWCVAIDGKQAQVFPAYYLFNGIRVPAGQHVIEMSFLPKWFVLGLMINLLSIIFLIFLFRKYRNPNVTKP